MNILMLAPHPFFQERGTPIAVDLLLRVLSEDGHRIHLLTYHEGEDRAYPGVVLHRIAAPPGVSGVPPGFSAKKLICDLWMILAAVRLARRLRPDLIHAVEESVFMARGLQPWLGIPYLYDMDSQLAAQVVEKHHSLGVLKPLFRAFERSAIRGAVAVAPVCRALADLAEDYGARKVVLLADIALPADHVAPVDPELPPVPGARVLYVGNLEAYQGIDLLLRGFASARREEPGLVLTVVGGTPAQVRRYGRAAASLGIADAVQFAGPRPLAQLDAVLAEADILVSPRIQGVNTPMKIYSYLRSGRPVLATRLPTHTQVLTDRIACLADPEPGAWSAALVRLARNPALRDALGKAGRGAAEQQHTFEAFARQVRVLYRGLEQENQDPRPLPS